MKKFNFLIIVICLFLSTNMIAQSTLHPVSSQYVYPEDTVVAEKLEQWRDKKFGMIIHWGLYAVPGIVESWTLCSEDWISRDSTVRYDDYKRWYWGLKDKFNPQQFNPDQWADAAASAGMKYVVFTTKHHDGFNMFDTQYSDYKVSAGPFKNHPKKNVAKYVFEAFRKKDFMIGAYYSKPDWHSQYFWWDLYATPNRNVNYDIRKHPWRWNKFVQFTHNQINELTSGYGKIDILWLDGGWIRPRNTVNEEVLSWGAPIPDFDQEINMPEIAKTVRNNQKGILIVDRTVHGLYENYRTPEQGIPDNMSMDPWESCITLGGAWGYVPNDRFKSAVKVIHLLIEIVAKGGNLLLGVGPNAEGILLPEQISSLEKIGQWLNKNGESIYGTRAISDFKENNIYFTQAKDKTHFALIPISDQNPLPKVLRWSVNLPSSDAKMMLVGYKEYIPWKMVNNNVVLDIPQAIWKEVKNEPAIVLKY
jgi:alpha-L-fucosidase